MFLLDMFLLVLYISLSMREEPFVAVKKISSPARSAQ